MNSMQRKTQGAKDLIWLALHPHFLKVHQDAMVLSSMEKSGTNYVRLFLTNYIYNSLSGAKEFEKIEYDRMHNELFKNIRYFIISRETPFYPPTIPLRFSNQVSYSDFMYDHGCFLDKADNNTLITKLSGFRLTPKKTLFLYRNPYDILISRFFYFFKNRIGRQDQKQHPRELIDTEMPRFARKYANMKRRSSTDSGYELIAYEDLKLHTEKAFTLILHHFELPIDLPLLHFSIEAASAKSVKETENRMGKAIHGPKTGLSGSFVRSGNIGQWKEYFNQQDKEKINQILKNHSIDISEFILED